MISKASVLLVVICVAVYANAMADAHFSVLEAQALQEVTEALNQDLLDGHGLPRNDVKEDSMSLLETLTSAEAQVGTKYDEYFDHYVDDMENEKFAAKQNDSTNPADLLSNTTIATPDPADLKSSMLNQSAPTNVSNNPEDIRIRESTSLNHTHTESNWDNRRRYSYNDADMDAIDEIGMTDEDPEGDFKRLISDPHLEIYDTDEDKGVYFGPSKVDRAARIIKLRRALEVSLRDAQKMRELRELAEMQAKYPPGTIMPNSTANATNSSSTPQQQQGGAPTPAAFVEGETEATEDSSTEETESAEEEESEE